VVLNSATSPSTSLRTLKAFHPTFGRSPSDEHIARDTHRNRNETRQRLRFFWLILIAIFFWELITSRICHAHFDRCQRIVWQSGTVWSSPKFSAAQTATGSRHPIRRIGLATHIEQALMDSSPNTSKKLSRILHFHLPLSICVYCNIWVAQKFTFLSQLLFSRDSASSNYVVYNQTKIPDTKTYYSHPRSKRKGSIFFRHLRHVSLHHKPRSHGNHNSSPAPGLGGHQDGLFFPVAKF